MGKAKKAQPEEATSFPADLKGVLALTADQRSKWLLKACKKAADGKLDPKQLYDVLSSRRIANDLPDKVGRRMLKTLRDNLWVFSEKQRRYLGEESVLAVKFGESSEESSDGGKADKVDVTTKRGAGGGGGEGGGGGGGGAMDAAARMEEMMARCRDFVRANAGSYEDRQREAEKAEQQAREEEERRLREEAERKARAERERLAAEWSTIAEWHRPLEVWERGWMAALDDVEIARAARKALEPQPAENEKQAPHSKADKEESGRSRERSRDRDRQRDRERNRDREKDRSRDRRRRRRRSSSRDA